MVNDLSILAHRPHVPALFADAGEKASNRLIQFFVAEIRNPNTRAAYAWAIHRFAHWCEDHNLPLTELEPVHVGTYIEELGKTLAAPSVKQHLAALRMLFNYCVIGQVIQHNPAAAVRGPKYSVKKGKTPILTARETKMLFDQIGDRSFIALRDRALIGVMAYSFARISAVLGMNVEDFITMGRNGFLRFHEKNGKEHEVPAHSKLCEYLDDYIAAAGIAGSKKSPLFLSCDPTGRPTANRLGRREALAMVKRRSVAAGLGNRIGNHTFRATGITTFLENDGSLETAQLIAAHESPRTTKLYDRRQDELTREEIERVKY